MKSPILQLTEFWNHTVSKLRFGILALVSCFIFITLTPALAVQAPRSQNNSSEVIKLAEALAKDSSAEDWLNLGKQHYEAGHWVKAAQAWEWAAAQFAQRNRPVAQAAALRYLAIAQQDLGNLSAAETAINQAWTIISSSPQMLLSAQVLNTQGTIQLSQSKARDAYATFRQAETIYQDLSDRPGVILSQINQVQTLQALGFYRRAEVKLLRLQQNLNLEATTSASTTSNPGDSDQLQAEILFSLGQVWERIGNLPEAQGALERSATIFEKLGAKEQLASLLLLQGDIAREQQQFSEAKLLYQTAQAIAAPIDSASPSSHSVGTEAQLHQLRLLIQLGDLTTARRLGHLLQEQLESAPINHWQIEARVNLAESFRLMADTQPGLELLGPALERAKLLGDNRAESYVLGQQGHLYEDQKDWAMALEVTGQARQKSAELEADEITTHWLWQEGRILKAQGDKAAAISAYSEAVQLLQSLRQDLVAINPEVQFSFRDEVEPVYRQLVELLLQDVDGLPANLKQQQLEQARQTIEALQLAQVQNFLREACETYDMQPIEQIDPQAAVFYPIVLGDRLEVVLALPGLPLQHYGSQLSGEEQQRLFAQLRQSLNPAFPPSDGFAAAQQFYDQLIRPGEAWLTQQKIKTLVFVLDDFLRDIPMAVLHDGDRYLVEKYSLALTPGLQLFDAKPLADERLQVLAGGLSQARQGFSALPGVEQELQSISQRPKTKLRATVLLDQAFTAKQLIHQAKARSFNLLHLATHGQFSSKAKDTFLLTWNDRLGIKELDQWLNPIADGEPRTPIEMLILSACQTAKGDRRATLGLAGLAVRSGARSTLATLWSVQDQSTAQLIETFYEQLIQEEEGRAEALRQAQLALIGSAEYSHPYYWAPFVLVGNWQ